MVRAVSDSGPIIHLAEVNCFHVLRLRIAEVVIPAAIYNEVTRYNRPGSKELKESGIAVIELSEEEKVLAKRLCSTYGIEVGEAEGISLCISRGYDLFFTDDADARDVGELYSIEVHGTAGIIAKAFRSGSLSYEKTKQVMLELHKKSSLYMTQRVYKIVMEMIEEQTREHME